MNIGDLQGNQTYVIDLKVSIYGKLLPIDIQHAFKTQGMRKLILVEMFLYSAIFIYTQHDVKVGGGVMGIKTGVVDNFWGCNWGCKKLHACWEPLKKSPD